MGVAEVHDLHQYLARVTDDEPNLRASLEHIQKILALLQVSVVYLQTSHVVAECKRVEVGSEVLLCTLLEHVRVMLDDEVLMELCVAEWAPANNMLGYRKPYI